MTHYAQTPEGSEVVQRGERAGRPTAAGVTAQQGRLPWAMWLAGLVFLTGAMAASGALVFKHFTNAELPGCRKGSACDGLEDHVLGRIMLPPGLVSELHFTKWPTSFLGLTFFAAIAAAWLVGFRRIAPGLRWLIRAGFVVSLVYVTVIVIDQKYCKYCLASHGANLGLLLAMEIGLMMSNRSGLAARETAGGSRRMGVLSLAAFAVAFVGVTGLLGTKEYSIARAAEAKLDQSQQEMIDKAKRDAAAAASQSAPADESRAMWPNGFTGRWRMGPKEAPVRIVMFGGYTCRFCKTMEQIAMDLVKQNPGKVSLSFKHYAMCADCNDRWKNGEQPEMDAEHRNACWAARMAEASAIYAGAQAAMSGEDQWTAANEAFWKAHEWLYARGGVFNDKELEDGIKSLGLDADKVMDLMAKPAANNPVVSDIKEGHALGLFQTPMIFINGVELKGWQQPGALERAVGALLAANAPAVDARNDLPPLARDKVIDDWRQEAVVQFAPDATVRAIGDPAAPVRIVIFGDYQEENTAKADAMVRSWIAGKGGTAKDSTSAKPIRYEFRHFPGDVACNPAVSKTFFEHGCLTARAAEAAGLVGGEDGYWKMHAWLLTNQKGMGYDAVKRGARASGLDADLVAVSLNKPEVSAAIADDVAAAQRAAVKQIPAIYVNGKFVKTWTREGDNVLGRIVDEAAGAKK